MLKTDVQTGNGKVEITISFDPNILGEIFEAASHGDRAELISITQRIMNWDREKARSFVREKIQTDFFYQDDLD